MMIDQQEYERLQEFARLVVSLDDPEGTGAEIRKSVTLGQIIEWARDALGEN